MHVGYCENNKNLKSLDRYYPSVHMKPATFKNRTRAAGIKVSIALCP